MVFKLIVPLLVAALTITCVSALSKESHRYGRSVSEPGRLVRQAKNPFGVSGHSDKYGYGAGVDYKGDRYYGSANAEHRYGQGTDVGAEAGGKVWESKDGKMDVQAKGRYDQHFGGPYGKSQPNYGGAVRFGFGG